MYSIGEMARRSGVKVPTIRYYEQMGLLAAPGRTDGNQRRYGEDELERLVFVRHARDLGIAIDAIRELLELSGHPDRPCRDADRIAAEHLQAVREKIARLQRLEAELDRIATHCEGDTVKDCYVIQALGRHDLCENEH
ncbi:MerR family transcriptional regulator [Mesorhizobium xinjiangense]|uniref:MerR family transcriptional regulator n=1 Tax=Mesorhizobium xinjiangense TaxID=2678685 RepID=UPI0012ECCBAE|nr:helix-turn-helix domain-containing protein [Mesorhizobium xinjiangense]